MSDQLTEQKKNLTLDTDWLSAAGMVALFLICGFLGTGTVWLTLRGSFTVLRISWATPLAAGILLWFGFSIPDRRFSIPAVLLALGPISRIVLWLLHASAETQSTNTVFING